MLRETMNELEKSKDELSETLEKEKELGELKSRFVTMASHEFRTPLSAILSSAFLLEKYNTGNEESKREKHIVRIKNAVSAMKNILEDFLSLGKLEEGLVHVLMEELSPEDFLGLIENVITDIEPILKPGQQIKMNCAITSVIKTDKNLFKNILINLISNAIKFSGENTMIEISCFKKNKELVLIVTDQGIGISKEDQQHLFSRFFRAKNATNIQGTGLGLHIISLYLELMNGQVTLKSELDKGSIFSIHLPQ